MVMHRSVLVRHVSPSAQVTNIANRRALGLPGPGLRTGRIIPSAVDVATGAPLVDGLATLAMHLPLAYEPVALPCSLMKCGDVVYRRWVGLVCGRRWAWACEHQD